MQSTPPHSDPPVVPTARPRLDFIDALRALAALYVAAGHAFGQLQPCAPALEAAHPRLGAIVNFLLQATLRHGHLAVALFIVISGFCLMIPLAWRGHMHLENTVSFLRRRARRILPPYFAALAFTLLLLLAVPRMNVVTKGEWFSAQPTFTTAAIVPHLLLIHHWRDDWILKINPPFWSIGVEWQIYFLMPLLFLPLWQRLGKGGMLLAMAALGLALTYGLQPWLPEKQTFIHFIALFAAGMTAAWVALAPEPGAMRWRRQPAWKWCFLFLAGFIVLLLALQTRRSLQEIGVIKIIAALTYSKVWVMDYLLTASVCALMIALLHRESVGWDRSLAQALEWRPLVFVGHFSYSLYLIHDPMLRLIATLGEVLSLGPVAQYLLVFGLGLPCSVIAGYLLYLAVERHFISMVPAHSR